MSIACLPAPRPHRGASRAALALTCITLAAGAAAADFSIGVGGGVSRGKTDCLASWPCDHGDSHAKAFAGYRPIKANDAIELQASHFDAGRFQGADVTPRGTAFGGEFKVSGLALTGGYRWTFAPGWQVTGRLGIASVRTRFRYAAPFGGDVSKTVTEPYAAVSLGCAVTPAWQLSLDLDQTRFKVHTTRGPLRMLGVAAQFSF